MPKTAAQLGIKAPKEGFQDLGWYDGYQYKGGTFADARGVIHPDSNQVGAGQKVSEEVNRASAAAQGKSYPEFKAYLEGSNKTAYRPGVGSGGAVSGGGSATAGGGGGIGLAGSGMGTQAAINLPELYKGIYESSGIKDLQDKLSEQERGYIDATGQINDNPFLSEATRVGRVAKLDELYQKRTANLRNDIATAKADNETRLNLELKQFDINSEAAKQALDQFNTLLSMGALDNASGEDIAQLTRATGLSSGAIQSAIQKKNQTNRDTQVITSTADDGTVSAVVIDKQTGEIIAQNDLGKIGNRQNSGGGKAPSEREVKSYYLDNLRSDIANYRGIKDIYNLYSGYLDPNEILQIYNATSPFGPAKESYEELSRYGVKAPTGYEPDYGY